MEHASSASLLVTVSGPDPKETKTKNRDFFVSEVHLALS